MGRPEGESKVQKISCDDLFPMIPPQVNGATVDRSVFRVSLAWFPMIPPQVNGATTFHSFKEILSQRKRFQ